ncbi:unnamed protein product [Prorocentrum cordatum]|uniref:Inositol polyphosphate-related phosphatase domain-containing protein n=1 Tax=Prorocentrum cordatum TaxID=2364126 RepID=A0ABN9TP18_9DINO|nr:unnamed protein product [Polarella glacialis]
MVGLTLLVYVQGSLRPYLGGVDCDRVKTGMDGMSGNKGCVCVRSEHLWQILSDAFQGTSIRGRGKLRAPKMGFLRQSRYFACDHGLLVLFGDMNIRLELLPEEQRPPGGPEAWLDRDQLSLGKLPSLRGFREGDIRFAPTFKYVPGSSTFSDKRCPAWTDRVVFKAASGVDVELLEYDSFPQMMHTSDHHAIAAQFFVAGAGSVESGLPPSSRHMQKQSKKQRGDDFAFLHTHTYRYIYIYIHIYVSVCIYIYIYIYGAASEEQIGRMEEEEEEEEEEKEGGRRRGGGTHTHISIYIYIDIDIQIPFSIFV